MFPNELARFFNQIVIQLIIEGGTATAIFVRCFTDQKGIERELERRLHVEFPRAVLATISVIYSLCYILRWMFYKFLYDFRYSLVSTCHNVTGFVGFNDSL
jgi:hypothetical protein